MQPGALALSVSAYTTCHVMLQFDVRAEYGRRSHIPQELQKAYCLNEHAAGTQVSKQAHWEVTYKHVTRKR